MMSVYLSQSHNPFLNLATENWLYHEILNDQPILFLWRNQPSVIIGRAQNPWVECNIPAIKKDNAILVRRQSGGGTVYHDLGNTNFTFLMPKAHFNKTDNLKMIVSVLGDLGIDAEISPRNDILVDGHKVSGSAFRESKDRAFHHGTLLINAELDALANYLNPMRLKLRAKGVKSVRSPVMNLSEKLPKLDHRTICQQLSQTFIQKFGGEPIEISETEISSIPSIQENADMLASWEWQYGKTLKFEQTIELTSHTTLTLNVNHAKITCAKLVTNNNDQPELNSIEECLIGVPYQREKILEKLNFLNSKPTEIIEKLTKMIELIISE